MTEMSSNLALKGAVEHAVDEGMLQLIGASYKMTATGLQHLQGAWFSSETDPKEHKEQMVLKTAVKKSTTRTKTGAAASKKTMKGRVKAGVPAASKKKTDGTTKKTNGSAMRKVKTQARTSADAKTKDKLTTTSNNIVAAPVKGKDAEAPAEPTLSDERPPADGEEPQTETEREEDEEGELPNPPVGSLEAKVAVGGKDEDQVTPEKNKINGRGSGGLDVGQGPGAPRKKLAHGGVKGRWVGI